MASNELICRPQGVLRFYRQLIPKLWKAACGRYRRSYLQLKPPCSREQLLLNVKTRRKLRFAIRDRIDLRVLNQVFLDDHYDISRLARAADIVRRYETILAAGRTPLIIDCGANIGISAAFFVDVFPKAQVVAIEPDAGNFALATRNCAGSTVDVVHAAVASENKRGVVIDPGHGGWSYRVEEREDGSVSLVSINSILADPRYAACEPFIVKIDIEGFEGEMFAKNTEWVDRFALLIIELHDWMLPAQGTSRPFLSVIATLDRDFVHIGENIFSISNRSS